jgi:hypothetical protein
MCRAEMLGHGNTRRSFAKGPHSSASEARFVPAASFTTKQLTWLRSACAPVIVAATDTIQYVATDQNGLAATSTRTVIVEAADAPSNVPTDDASTSTAATSSTQ